MVPYIPSQLNRAGIPVDQGVALLQGGLGPVSHSRWRKLETSVKTIVTMESIVIIMNKYGMHEKYGTYKTYVYIHYIYIYIIIYNYKYIYILQFMNINKVYKTTHSWGHPVAFNFQTSLQNKSSRWGNCKSSYPGFCYIKMCLKIECIPSYSLNVSAYFFRNWWFTSCFREFSGTLSSSSS